MSTHGQRSFWITATTSACRCLNRRLTRLLEGLQAALDFLADKEPKAKQFQPKDFVDTSLLDELAKTPTVEKR